jgi:MATE family multidrug resistance protein
VDTVMVGPLGPEAIAATGLGNGVFIAIAIFWMGLLLGLDPLVSQAYGAGRLAYCRTLLHQGLWLALFLSPLVMLLNGLAYATIGWWGLNPAIEALARPYFAVINISSLPLLVYAAFRRYLQGIHVVRPIMIALLTANLVNVAANYALIYGHFGLPALGVPGSALATTISRIYMAILLWRAAALTTSPSAERAAMPSSAGVFEPARRPNRGIIKALLGIGLPAAAQITLEVGAFTVATAFAARLDAVSSASHQIALNIAGFTYMVPLGLCSAAAVRVGHAIGAEDRPRAIRSGWLAIGMSVLLASLLALVMVTLPGPILRIFTGDARVVALGTTLLAIAAAFQLFDGIQTVAIGALRGTGDTVASMVINLVVHWCIGLPIGYVLCFWFGWGVTGIWTGFSVGLVVAAVALLSAWIRSTRVLRAAALAS